MTLSLVTLNVLDDLLHWRERAPLILAELEHLRPQVIALQEVASDPSAPELDGAESSAHWLAERLDGYAVLLARKTDHPASDSLAVLTSLDVATYDLLTFAAQGRLAQRVVLNAGSERWQLVNTHLSWNPVDESPRVRQAAELLEWIPRTPPATICGDFNAFPGSRTLQTFSARFTSAHRAKHGAEPLLTYPTLLRRGPGLRHWSRHAVLHANGLVRLRRNIRYGGTVDYILVDAHVTVRECAVAFDRPSATDPRIFASDHLGLHAVLEQWGGGPSDPRPMTRGDSSPQTGT